MNDRQKIGALMFTGGAWFMLSLILAETQYPGYSAASNYISDLGVWSQPSAYIFNPSVVLYGLLSLAAAYVMLARLKWRVQGALLAVAGIGGIGVGIFNELTGAPHVAFAFMAFVGTSLVAFSLKNRLEEPAGYIGTVLGIISLIALVLLGIGNDLGLGAGGMERMITYPQLAFTLMASGSFLSSKD
jgi:hypothetical membrane protein